VVKRLKHVLDADDVVLGGGNAKRMRKLPAGVRIANNTHAFLGGTKLWHAGRRRRTRKPAPARKTVAAKPRRKAAAGAPRRKAAVPTRRAARPKPAPARRVVRRKAPAPIAAKPVVPTLTATRNRDETIN